jgi:uncharacterized membrane protein
LRFLIAYAATAATFLALDYLWLSYAGERIYRPALGNLMAETPNIPIAAAFYLVYAVGIVVFAVGTDSTPRTLLNVAALGALLGLVAYGTYDITNMATLRGWPVSVSLIDMAWGTFLTATSSVAGALAVRAWA